jgi:hypothetical protein
MSNQDEIVEEVRKARQSFAARFDFDVARMFGELKQMEQRHPERISELKPVEKIVRSR